MDLRLPDWHEKDEITRQFFGYFMMLDNKESLQYLKCVFDVKSIHDINLDDPKIPINILKSFSKFDDLVEYSKVTYTDKLNSRNESEYDNTQDLNEIYEDYHKFGKKYTHLRENLSIPNEQKLKYFETEYERVKSLKENHFQSYKGEIQDQEMTFRMDAFDSHLKEIKNNILRYQYITNGEPSYNYDYFVYHRNKWVFTNEIKILAYVLFKFNIEPQFKPYHLKFQTRFSDIKIETLNRELSKIKNDEKLDLKGVNSEIVYKEIIEILSRFN